MSIFAFLYLYNYYFIGCGIVYSVYGITNRLCHRYFPHYRTIGKDNQDYVVSNVSKSLVLLFITLKLFDYPSRVFISIFEGHEDLAPLVSMYAACDMVGLVCVRKNKLSTILHHVFVNILALLSIYYDAYNGHNVWKLTFCYGLFSGWAYIVNAFLGMRFLYRRKNNILVYTAFFSSVIYLFCCVFNWILQVYYIITWKDELFTYQKMPQVSIYFAALYMWVNDDIKLMKFLYNYATTPVNNNIVGFKGSNVDNTNKIRVD